MKWIFFVVLLCACRQRAADHQTDVVRQRMRFVEERGTSCQPEAWRDIIQISEGRFAWKDGLSLPASSPDEVRVRCRARSLVYNLRLLKPDEPNIAWSDSLRSALDRPEVVDALTSMMSRSESDDCGTRPAGVAAQVLMFAPVEPLYARLRPGELEYMQRAQRPVSPRAAKIDSWAAQLDENGFLHVMLAASPTFRWDDGRPEPSGEEAAEIQKHIDGALEWLENLTNGRFRNSDRFECASALRKDLQDGLLGQAALGLIRKSNMRGKAIWVVMGATPFNTSETVARLQDSSDPEDQETAANLTSALAKEAQLERARFEGADGSDAKPSN